MSKSSAAVEVYGGQGGSSIAGTQPHDILPVTGLDIDVVIFIGMVLLLVGLILMLYLSYDPDDPYGEQQ